MSSRFTHREPRNNLFAAYDAQTSAASSKPSPASSIHRTSSPYASHPGNGNPYASSGAVSSSRPASGMNNGGPGGGAGTPGGFRSATPNSRGQYSDAVLNELESQNEEDLGGVTAKVRMLKDITLAINQEITSSTAFAEKLNDSFDGARVRLRGTMNRMLRMAERTGVGWKVWAGFFAAVIFLFWYVWLFV